MAAIPAMKRPVSFFLAEYEAFDHFGYLLAFLSLAPPFLVAIQAAVYGTLRLAAGSGFKGLQRPAQLAGSVLLGQLLNELLNLVLKNLVFRSQRPASDVATSDFGMPSSHAQFMAFLLASFPPVTRRLGTFLKWPACLEFGLIAAAFFGSFLIAFGR